MELPVSDDFRVVVADSKKDRAKWLESRRSVGISASNVPAVLGSSPFKSALALWGWYQGMIPDSEETDQMRWGNRLESIVGKVVADELELGFLEDQRLLQSSLHELVLATPDCWYIHPDGTLELGEIKTVKTYDFWEDGIPQHVNDQVQAQLFVTGCPRARIAVFFRAEARHHYAVIERNDRWIKHVMLPGLEKFWDLVQTNVPPEADSSDSTDAAIRKMWPRPTRNKPITLPNEILSVHDALEEAREELSRANAKQKAAKKKKRGLENKIKALMGVHEIALIEGTNLVYTNELTEVAERVSAGYNFRQLRIKKVK